MLTDTEIKIKGLRVLIKELGKVEAEKFISILLREPFDYTKWQKHLFEDVTVEELSKRAMKSRKSK